MGILSLLIDGQLEKAAINSGDPERIQEIADMYECRRLYEMRGERRVAVICNALFGWKIPDELKDID